MQDCARGLAKSALVYRHWVADIVTGSKLRWFRLCIINSSQWCWSNNWCDSSDRLADILARDIHTDRRAVFCSFYQQTMPLTNFWLQKHSIVFQISTCRSSVLQHKLCMTQLNASQLQVSARTHWYFVSDNEWLHKEIAVVDERIKRLLCCGLLWSL